MNKKIFVVDDDTAILEAIRIILEDEGYQTITFSSGNGIVENTRKHMPDLILLDYSLSGENGGDIAQNLRKTADVRHIPIILLSAHPNIENIAKSSSFDAFLPKPFSIDELLHVLQNQIN